MKIHYEPLSGMIVISVHEWYISQGKSVVMISKMNMETTWREGLIVSRPVSQVHGDQGTQDIYHFYEEYQSFGKE